MNNPTKKLSGKKLVLVALTAVLIVVVLLALLDFTNTTRFFHDTKIPKYPVTASQDTKGEPAQSQSNKTNSSTQSGTTTPSSQPGDQKSNSGGSTTNNASLLVPNGDFVSNHHPNLSGSPAPSVVTSVCTTTPGASCSISFNNGSVTKSLPAQIADRGGTVYWNNWKLQDYGITAGSWKIIATATLDGQTKVATDALSLEVAQ